MVAVLSSYAHALHIFLLLDTLEHERLTNRMDLSGTPFYQIPPLSRCMLCALLEVTARSWDSSLGRKSQPLPVEKNRSACRIENPVAYTNFYRFISYVACLTNL